MLYVCTFNRRLYTYTLYLKPCTLQQRRFTPSRQFLIRIKNTVFHPQAFQLFVHGLGQQKEENGGAGGVQQVEGGAGGVDGKAEVTVILGSMVSTEQLSTMGP